jgi:hypothetical protein
MGKKAMPKRTDVVSASEIGQFTFCSYAWYLRRCGYEPESPYLEPGRQAHVALGERMDSLEVQMHRSAWYVILGVTILGVAVLLLLFGVMV